jgi:hypothetical protein
MDSNTQKIALRVAFALYVTGAIATSATSLLSLVRNVKRYRDEMTRRGVITTWLDEALWFGMSSAAVGLAWPISIPVLIWREPKRNRTDCRCRCHAGNGPCTILP